MESIILPYINPDLDGVACSIALSDFDPMWAPRILGRIDEETQVVLDALHITAPKSITDWNAVQRIWLVDTHHPKQLPADFPDRLVVRITDHHSGGEPARYPNAEIQNDSVGAAATLVTERFESAGVRMTATNAVLLQAAIVSNTLNFQAPATSSRDTVAFEKLKSVMPAPDELFSRMREARRAILQLDTAGIVQADKKSFDTSYGTVVISQIESPGALDLLARSDLISSLKEMTTTAGAASAILNIVDTEAGASALIITDPNITRLLSLALRESVNDNGVIRVNRVLQRKTDIVPFILH
jgi:manganese-dependent inorganic pyrophosphatase